MIYHNNANFSLNYGTTWEMSHMTYNKIVNGGRVVQAMSVMFNDVWNPWSYWFIGLRTASLTIKGNNKR